MVVASLAVLLIACGGGGPGPRIKAGDWSFVAGSPGNGVLIEMTGLPSEGLGAADISVEFDPTVLNIITGCNAGDLSGVCNAHSPDGPARAAGFAAPAITEEPTIIAILVVDCVGRKSATSPLTITVNEVVDGTEGDPQPISAKVEDGTVVCAEPGTPTADETPPADDSAG